VDKAIRRYRAREDQVVEALATLAVRGLVPEPPRRLDERELRQGYAAWRTPWLELFMCGDVCSGWTPDSAVVVEQAFVASPGTTPEAVCRDLVSRFGGAGGPTHLTVSERGPIDERGCGLEGTGPHGVRFDIGIHRRDYGDQGPIFVSASGILR
jgi:hypothetical protein